MNFSDHEDLKAQVKRHALAGRVCSIILDSERERAKLALIGSQNSLPKVSPLKVQKISAARSPPASSATASIGACATPSASDSKGCKSLSATALSDTTQVKATPFRVDKSKPLPPQPSRLKAASVIHHLANRDLHISERERKVLTVVANAVEDEKYVDQELKNLIEEGRLRSLLYGPDSQPASDDNERSSATTSSTVPQVQDHKDAPT